MIWRGVEAQQFTFQICSWIQSCFFFKCNFFHLKKLNNNCFIILSWFLPYINMNQPQVYKCPLCPESPPHLPEASQKEKDKYCILTHAYGI